MLSLKQWLFGTNCIYTYINGGSNARCSVLFLNLPNPSHQALKRLGVFRSRTVESFCRLAALAIHIWTSHVYGHSGEVGL